MGLTKTCTYDFAMTIKNETVVSLDNYKLFCLLVTSISSTRFCGRDISSTTSAISVLDNYRSFRTRIKSHGQGGQREPAALPKPAAPLAWPLH